MREDMESVSCTNVLTVAFIVLVVATKVFSAQSTSAQIIYPGIVVNFTCKVAGPFIQVNGSEITTERGVGGYVEDLLDMGIEAKNVTMTPQLTFIPTVCVNGSYPQLGNRSSTTITIICQNFQLENGQFITIHHFNFTLKYQSRLPAPANVSMSDNNILEWSRPPCVTNSSSDTYSIEVNHTLEFTYTIFITHTTDGTTTTITVSTTSYDLSNELQPCSEYTIEVCACNSETVCNDNERSPPISFTMPGCPVNTDPPASEDTAATTIPSSPATEQEDSTKQTTTVVTGVVCSVVFCGSGFVCGILSVLVYNHIETRKKNNNTNTTTTTNNNNTVGARVSTQPAPVYEEVFEPRCSVEMKENVAYGPISKTK